MKPQISFLGTAALVAACAVIMLHAGAQKPTSNNSAAKPIALTRPILFHTSEADAILAKLQVFPPDNAWNRRVDGWQLHPDSKAIVASIGADKPLRYNDDMGFILVPPDQKRVPVKLMAYPDESEPGPYPVPDNVPIEG